MKSINRGIAIVKPKQPFLDWLKQLPDPETDLTLEDLRMDCMSFLVPEFDDEKEADSFIYQFHEKIFEAELMSWYTDRRYRPKKRTLELFKRWFDVEKHSEIIDFMAVPIEEKDYDW